MIRKVADYLPFLSGLKLEIALGLPPRARVRMSRSPFLPMLEGQHDDPWFLFTLPSGGDILMYAEKNKPARGLVVKKAIYFGSQEMPTRVGKIGCYAHSHGWTLSTYSCTDCGEGKTWWEVSTRICDWKKYTRQQVASHLLEDAPPFLQEIKEIYLHPSKKVFLDRKP